MSHDKLSQDKFKLVCEACGSLTVALPVDANPDPQSILKCGRCGFDRGSLQSLRDSSIGAKVAQVDAVFD
jgi:hypothetical protein